MTNAHPTGSGPARRHVRQPWWLVLIERLGLNVFIRIYALALVVLIGYVSFQAVRYLVVALFTPSDTPAQITGLPRHFDEKMISRNRPEWEGRAAVENPRTPPSHYHRFDTLLQTDRFNDCTRSGCHAQLPHSRKKEDRAFLNMHATSMQCGVCHFKQDAAPLPMTWYDLHTGRASGPPALLRAYAWIAQHLSATSQPQYTRGDQAEIVALLRDAARQADDDPSLSRIAEHLYSVASGSESFQRLVESARDVVARSMRGAYGAKLALKGNDGQPILRHLGAEAAVKEYLAGGAKLPPDERAALLKRMHPLRREQPLQCSNCHRPEGSLVPHKDLGYPPVRIRELLDPAVFQMIENIANGRPFYLPSFISPASTPTTMPTSMPTSRPASMPDTRAAGAATQATTQPGR